MLPLHCACSGSPPPPSTTMTDIRLEHYLSAADWNTAMRLVVQVPTKSTTIEKLASPAARHRGHGRRRRRGRGWGVISVQDGLDQWAVIGGTHRCGKPSSFQCLVACRQVPPMEKYSSISAIPSACRKCEKSRRVGRDLRLASRRIDGASTDPLMIAHVPIRDFSLKILETIPLVHEGCHARVISLGGGFDGLSIEPLAPNVTSMTGTVAGVRNVAGILGCRALVGAKHPAEAHQRVYSIDGDEGRPTAMTPTEQGRVLAA